MQASTLTICKDLPDFVTNSGTETTGKIFTRDGVRDDEDRVTTGDGKQIVGPNDCSGFYTKSCMYYRTHHMRPRPFLCRPRYTVLSVSYLCLSIFLLIYASLPKHSIHMREQYHHVHCYSPSPRVASQAQHPRERAMPPRSMLFSYSIIQRFPTMLGCSAIRHGGVRWLSQLGGILASTCPYACPLSHLQASTC
jgi:hypothetical protein